MIILNIIHNLTISTHAANQHPAMLFTATHYKCQKFSGLLFYFNVLSAIYQFHSYPKHSSNIPPSPDNQPDLETAEQSPHAAFAALSIHCLLFTANRLLFLLHLSIIHSVIPSALSAPVPAPIRYMTIFLI